MHCICFEMHLKIYKLPRKACFHSFSSHFHDINVCYVYAHREPAVQQCSTLVNGRIIAFFFVDDKFGLPCSLVSSRPLISTRTVFGSEVSPSTAPAAFTCFTPRAPPVKNRSESILHAVALKAWIAAQTLEPTFRQGTGRQGCEVACLQDLILLLELEPVQWQIDAPTGTNGCGLISSVKIALDTCQCTQFS